MIPLLILASFCDQSHLCRAKLYANLARIVDDFRFRNFTGLTDGQRAALLETHGDLLAASNRELNAGVNELLN